MREYKEEYNNMNNGNMKNLSLDDGFESFAINGDPNRVLRFNPGDVNIMTRYKEVVENINKIAENLPDVPMNPDGTPKNDIDSISEQLKAFDTSLKEQINYLLNADVYDVLFYGQSPLCCVGGRAGKGKKLLCEEILDKLGKLIGEACGQSVENVNIRVNKYTADYKKPYYGNNRRKKQHR